MAKQMTDKLPEMMSKTAYAAHRGVSKGALSQYIKKGFLTGEAFAGGENSRTAKIVVGAADAQLTARLDMGQQLGNGAKSASNRNSSEPVVDRYKDIKTERAEIDLQKERAAYLAEQGQYIKTEDAQALLMQGLSLVVSMFDMAASKLADELASEFKLSSHELNFKIRDVMNETRTDASKAFMKKMELVDELIEVDDAGNNVKEPAAST